jgi:hypothetical protein
MFKKTILASAALALTMAPIAAQAAPQPAERIGASATDAEQLRGPTKWILGIIALGLIIWGIIEITDDGSPASP